MFVIILLFLKVLHTVSLLIAAKLFLPFLVSVQLFITVDLYLKCVALNFKMFVCHPLLQEKEDMFHILASVLAMGQLKIDANDDDAAYVTNEAAAQRVGVRLLFDMSDIAWWQLIWQHRLV